MPRKKGEEKREKIRGVIAKMVEAGSPFFSRRKSGQERAARQLQIGERPLDTRLD